ncbi:MAG1210 family protein [Mycoplasmopsis hyopharyngis]|uniref:MAG1210 family protein n=1 Tax=Mycoplasmopsis hyopharyngis TaxID=29558 RepID=UPI003873AB8D
MENDKIFEPLREYESLREKHSKNVLKYFQDLVDQSQVNIDENKETIKKINQEKIKLESAKKDVAKYSNLNTFLSILISLGGIGILIGSYFAYLYSNTHTKNYLLTSILSIILGVIFVVAFSCVLALVTIPKKKEAVNRKEVQETLVEQLTDQATEQMRPLNSLFAHGIKEKLFSLSIPLLQLDRYFDNKRIDELKTKFGFQHKDNNDTSLLHLLSGEIYGNPFVLTKDLVHTMGTKKYHGTLVISWEETVSTSNGTSTITRTQTLWAEVSKPCPYYERDTYLVLGSDVEPQLSFKRESHNFHLLTAREKEKYVKETTKELKKFAEKQIGKSNFTLLANEEFESAWYAKNRNDEKGYRVLFTPLAQKNLMQLLSDNGVGFGDDFMFKKQGKLNLVVPEHLKKFDIDFDDTTSFYAYDFDVISKTFYNYNMEFFRHLFFTFAPIFSIPIYQQTKTHEHIYKDVYDSPRLNRCEHESIINKLSHLFKHDLSKTDDIIKTSFIQKTDKGDLVNVNSWGYQTFDRIDYIPVHGGDGYIHDVPVHWTEYVRVEQNSTVEIIPLNNYKVDRNAWQDEYNNTLNTPELRADLESGKIYDAKSSIVRVLNIDTNKQL